MQKVEYEGKVYQLVFNTGRVWREPPTGVVTEMFEGEEYDLTNYIEDEGWLIRNEEGVDSFVYASDCKVL